MLTTLLVLMLRSFPAPPPCDENAAKNRALTADAVKAASKVLPDARSRNECEMFSTTRQVRLEPAELQAGDVKFLVDAMVLGPNRGAWVAVPFADVAQMNDFAKRITSHPLVKQVSPGPLVCLASTNSPGDVSYFRCRAPKDAPKDRFQWSTPSSGYLPGDVTEFEFMFSPDARAGTQCGCEPFMLENFSAPMTSLPANAPGWCRGKEFAGVKKFIASATTPVQVTLAKWHNLAVRVRTADGKKYEEDLPGTGNCWCSPLPACGK